MIFTRRIRRRWWEASWEMRTPGCTLVAYDRTRRRARKAMLDILAARGLA